MESDSKRQHSLPWDTIVRSIKSPKLVCLQTAKCIQNNKMAVCISHRAYALRKGMNPSVLSSLSYK